MKNKGIVAILGLTLFICILGRGFKLTLLKNEWYYFLIAINLFVIYLKMRKEIFPYEFFIRGTMIVVILLLCMIGAVSLKDQNYYYIDSPRSKHHLVVKPYGKGFRPDGYLEVYEIYFSVFKKKVGNTIVVRRMHPLLGTELIVKKEDIIKLGNSYTLSSLNFKWINEDRLFISYKNIENLKEKEKTYAQTVINLGTHK